MNIEQIVNRRTAELHARTRSETLASIGAAVLFVGVLLLRLSPNAGPVELIGLGALVVWAAVSLYWFRRRIQRGAAADADAVANTGLDYYRQELEQRRDHLRNLWLWNGPLFLACLVLVGVLAGRSFMGLDRLLATLPLVILLAVWAAYGIWRRRRQATELQREIDEIGRR